MHWLPQAKEALDRAERVAISRMETINTTLDRIRVKKEELAALDEHLGEVMKDVEVNGEDATEKALKALSRENKRLSEELREAASEADKRLSKELRKAAAEAEKRNKRLAEQSQELERLRVANERLEGELRQNKQRADQSQELGRLRALNESLDGDLQRTRRALDRLTAVRETRVTTAEERTRTFENVLRDVHHALLHQPEQAREHIAKMISEVVEPYTPGEKPQ